MVGSNGTMIAIRLVRSKLRKREDHQTNAVHPESAAVVQTATSPIPCNGSTTNSIIDSTIQSAPVVHTTNCGGTVVIHNSKDCCTQIATITTSTDLVGNNCKTSIETNHHVYATVNPADQFVWQFPPPYPPHTPPPQYTLYNDQDTLVHALPSDRSGFAKGFRKNFGGRWRRLVKRKPETETCAIPPELKDQLKTIYVY